LTAFFAGKDKRTKASLVTKATLRDREARRRYKGGDVHQDFEVDGSCILGEGCSGSVFAGRCRRTGLQVAVKSYAKNKMSSSALESLRSEVNIYLMMHHAHIATLFTVYETPDSLSFVMELCAGSELY